MHWTELNREQLCILDHTVHRAANRMYCGDSPDMQVLVAAGLMKSAGRKSFVPSEYFTITPEGYEALRDSMRPAYVEPCVHTVREPETGEGEKQRCNHCMSVFDEALTSCPECGRDDALMYPFEPLGDELCLCHCGATPAVKYIPGEPCRWVVACPECTETTRRHPNEAWAKMAWHQRIRLIKQEKGG
jgi:hypothetical protein